MAWVVERIEEEKIAMMAQFKLYPIPTLLNKFSNHTNTNVVTILENPMWERIQETKLWPNQTSFCPKIIIISSCSRVWKKMPRKSCCLRVTTMTMSIAPSKPHINFVWLHHKRGLPADSHNTSRLLEGLHYKPGSHQNGNRNCFFFLFFVFHSTVAVLKVIP